MKLFSLDDLEQFWKCHSLNVNKINNRLALELTQGRTYIDYIEDGRNEYDAEELKNVKFDVCRFYSISYSSHNAQKILLQKSGINKEFYIDNDCGLICSVEEFLKVVVEKTDHS